jgi:hypothetical protein
VTVRNFGRGVAHAAVTRRPPIPLYTIAPPNRGLHVRREGLGFAPSFKGHSLSRRAKPYRYDSLTFASL